MRFLSSLLAFLVFACLVQAAAPAAKTGAPAAKAAAKAGAAVKVVAPKPNPLKCDKGVDVSTAVTAEQFKCLHKEQKVNYVTIRASQANCNPDPDAATTIRHAWAAGLQEVDIYLVPHFSCGVTATKQAEDTINHLKASAVKFGRAWLSIEPASGWHPTDIKLNVQHAQDYFNALVKAVGVKRVGIYGSAESYEKILGKHSFNTKKNTFPLWYANYDGKAEVNDEKKNAFGGWNKKTGFFMKQYDAKGEACGVKFDQRP